MDEDKKKPTGIPVCRFCGRTMKCLFTSYYCESCSEPSKRSCSGTCLDCGDDKCKQDDPDWISMKRHLGIP